MYRHSFILMLMTTAMAVADSPIVFRDHVIAALSHAGCNSGACHGSPQGKNGFRLSLRGFDPDLDLQTLTKEQGGRRINKQSPDDSLLLQKGSGRVNHQGGALFAKNGAAYQTIRRWILEGANDLPAKPIHKLDLQLSPDNRITATLRYQDETARQVNPLAVFSSTDSEIATVDHTGKVTFREDGETVILVRYLEYIASVRVSRLPNRAGFQFTGQPPVNFIDEELLRKQKEFQQNPLPLASDDVFIRRVYLDVIGTLPTAHEVVTFLDSKQPNKRAALIDALLERDEYAQFWALKWADVLRGNPATISERGVHSFHRYLVRTVAEDRPMTQFARELLTSQGNTLHRPAANFYRIARTPEDAAETAAQLFMGIRLQCAKCHNHPFESITQTDYYGLAAFFARVQFKGTSFGLDDEIVYLVQNRDVQHPRTRKNQVPVAFGHTPMISADEDRREKFAEWLTAKDNPYFASSLVNRVWYHLIGRGIVEPVDDFRDTNPPSHPKLLERLSVEFAKNEYRLKPIIKLILNSNAYQLAGLTNAKDAVKVDRLFIRTSVRMLTAEQILDAVSQATGSPEHFKGFPVGTRAIELPEGGINHPFLQAFSKPVRDVTCECAREEDPSMPQVMQLLNNDRLIEKIRSPKSPIATWVREEKTTDWIVEQIYLRTLSRRPTAKEKGIFQQHLNQVNQRLEALIDLQHALINLNEFVLRH